MTNLKRGTEQEIVLRMFQIIVGLGLLLSVVMIARNTVTDARHLLYTSWFAVTIISIEAVLHKIRIGIYALIAATILITVVDLVAGVATIGGATLGILVAFVIVTYVWPLWEQFE